MLHIVPIYLLGMAWQSLHLLEEFLTGFQIQYPVTFGAQPWSDDFFISLNLVLLSIFILAAAGLSLDRFQFVCINILWLFSIISILNGIVHPAISILKSSYFPGTITAPGHLVIGIWLVRSLIMWNREKKSASVDKQST